MLCTIRIERALRMPSTPKGICSEMKEREKYLIFNSKKKKRKEKKGVCGFFLSFVGIVRTIGLNQMIISKKNNLLRRRSA